MNYDGIYLACGITDLAVDGPAIIVKQEFNMDLFENYLFRLAMQSRLADLVSETETNS